MIGFFDFWRPTYILRDAEIISQIGITQFENFVDRVSLGNIETDTLYGKSLLLLCGDKWRAMRSTLTPSFTGSKLRNMFQFVDEAAQSFTQTLAHKVQQGSSDRFDMKHLFDCYSIDLTLSSHLFGGRSIPLV